MDGIVITSVSKVTGTFSESEETCLTEPLAHGREMQSREKSDVLLRFANRICDGDAKPVEVAYMLALMAQDIPA